LADAGGFQELEQQQFTRVSEVEQVFFGFGFGRHEIR
jgi:hypothetical protein